MSTYGGFFEVMEELGLFGSIYEHLPPDFTAVFEIARILENAEHPLTQQLAPVLSLSRVTLPTDREERELSPKEIVLPIEEEQQAQLIRHVRDITRIYPHQHLLPDEVFYRRLAERTLWMPSSVKPRIYPVEPESEGFHPDSRKQKVYILLDTSSSMRVKNRIHLAKAVTFYFLKHNLRELGQISLRTFDVDVGELHEAVDQRSYETLMTTIMQISTLGQGTAMSRAIYTAIDDLRALPNLSGAELLIITDGACTLDREKIREACGDDIVINTLKIGHMSIYPGRTYAEDFLEKGDTLEHRTLRKLRQKKKQLEREISVTAGETSRARKQYALDYVQEEIDALSKKLLERLGEVYGHELEQLSKVFIEIDDISDEEIYTLSQEGLNDLNKLFDEIVSVDEQGMDVMSLKKLVLLSDHIVMLLRHVKDQSLRMQLKELQTALQFFFNSQVGDHLEVFTSKGIRMTREERRDLRFLLEHTRDHRVSLWRIVLGYVRKIFQRIFRIRPRYHRL
ncbi:MAG: VWA domain-containing protein [Chlorobi bacterium]|nr:VWA domain-containing protein [Chlorobiota bacterium]